jgi:hypothetical protein
MNDLKAEVSRLRASLDEEQSNHRDFRTWVFRDAIAGPRVATMFNEKRAAAINHQYWMAVWREQADALLN